MNLIIIIPAFNEASMIGKVIDDLKSEGFANILVVDDGSKDDTLSLVKKRKVRVVSHLKNLGLGAALKTGLDIAKREKMDLAVTFDADGQHQASDIRNLIRPILRKEADVVIGSRLLKLDPKHHRIDQMSLVRKIVNYLSNMLIFLLYAVRTTDSQSGLRAFNRKAIRHIFLKTQRMEASSEIFGEIRKNSLKFTEIPISTIYTPYSIQKGQKVSNFAAVFAKILFRHFR